MKESREKIKNIIRGRPCIVMSKGKSLENLENMIETLKPYDICWVGQNRVNYIETGILHKIGEEFDLLSDCATVANKSDYEPRYRLPRFVGYLSRPNNLLMTSELVLNECFRAYGQQILDEYNDKIVTIDSLVFGEGIPKELGDPPPNSLTLLLCFLIAGGAKKIIICGVDGYTNNNINIFETYYRPDIAEEERNIAFGKTPNWRGSIPSDTETFNEKFPKLFELYKQTYNNPDVEIVNCSQTSLINVFRKINYSDLEKEIQ